MGFCQWTCSCSRIEIALSAYGQTNNYQLFLLLLFGAGVRHVGNGAARIKDVNKHAEPVLYIIESYLGGCRMILGRNDTSVVNTESGKDPHGLI